MKRILIVDDDGDMRAIYRYMLGGEAAGYDLRFARDGLQALRMLARKPADLVISDVIMKSMDGMTFVRRLREGGFSAPVLVVGNYWDPATRYEGAVRVSRLLPSSRLLSSDSWGHTAYGTSA